MDEKATTNKNDVVADIADFDTYEAFLDSLINETDIFYLEDEELARQLVELGYRGTGEIMRRNEFYERKKLMKIAAEQHQDNSVLAHLGAKLNDPFDQALAFREEANRNGQLSTILFIRDFNSKGQEISGYIDYDHRLRTEEFRIYFKAGKKLLPKATDLSYYNWESNLVVSNSSPNYTVIAESSAGLMFKNKRDRKIVYVDPSQASPGDNTTRTVIKTPKYVQVIFYDHAIRRKN